MEPTRVLEPPQYIEDLRRELAALRIEAQAHQRAIELLQVQVERALAIVPSATQVPSLQSDLQELRSEARDMSRLMNAILTRAQEMSNVELRVLEATKLIGNCLLRIQELERESRAIRNEHDERALLSQRQFARRLGVSRNVIPRLVAVGLLHPVEGAGKHPRYAAADIKVLTRTGLKRPVPRPRKGQHT
jgi:DNA-binding transcriptional regulator YiaG